MTNPSSASPQGLAYRIYQLRRATALTQSALAKKIGRSAQYISAFEDGKVPDPAVSDLIALAEAFNLHPLELIAGFPKDVCAIAEELAALPPQQRQLAISLFRSTFDTTKAFMKWQSEQKK